MANGTSKTGDLIVYDGMIIIQNKAEKALWLG